MGSRYNRGTAGVGINGNGRFGGSGGGNGGSSIGSNNVAGVNGVYPWPTFDNFPNTFNDNFNTNGMNPFNSE